MSIHTAAAVGVDGLATIGKVVEHHKVSLELGLSEVEAKALIEYLKSL